MGGANVTLGRKSASVGGFDVRHGPIAHGNALHFGSAHHLSAAGLHHFDEGIGQCATFAHETRRSVDVQHADHGVHVGRRPTFHAAVQGIHVSHQFLQPLVRNVAGNKGVGREQKLLGHFEKPRFHRTQMEQIETFYQLVHRGHVVLQFGAGLREIARPTFDEPLSSFGDAIGGLLVQEGDFVHTLGIGVPQPELFEHTQVATQPPHVTSGAKTAE